MLHSCAIHFCPALILLALSVGPRVSAARSDARLDPAELLARTGVAETATVAATDSSGADSLASATPDSTTGARSAAADSAVSGAIAAVSFGDLAATTAPPWVPATPVEAERDWERAIRLPLRILTFPLSLLGDAAKSGGVFVEDHSLIPRSRVVLGALPRQGIYVAPPSLGDRTGFGLAFGYSPYWLKRYFLIEVSGSTLKYNRTVLQLGRGPVAFDYRYDWRPRERFYGIGMDSDQEDKSTFANREQHFDLRLFYPWKKHGEPPPRVQVTAHAGPRESILHRGREGSSFEEIFPVLTPQVDDRQEHFAYGAGVIADRRYGRPHWTHGWRGAVRIERLGKTLEWLAIRDAHANAPQFLRMSVEGQAGWSFHRTDPRTLRLAARVVNQRKDVGSSPLLLPDLMTLGGNSGLLGFQPGRFHDVDLVHTRLTYIFPMLRNFEMDLHAESGGVFPEMEHMRIDRFRNSFGAWLRLRSDVAPLAYVGFDRSQEGTRLHFGFGGID